MPEEKAYFVIAPISEPESDIRKRSDRNHQFHTQEMLKE
jgi:hypothetical protein